MSNDGAQAKTTTCSIASAVAADVLARAAVGLQKYGVTLARTDLSRQDWLQHLYEELLDAACYVKRLLEEENAAGYPAGPP